MTFRPILPEITRATRSYTTQRDAISALTHEARIVRRNMHLE